MLALKWRVSRKHLLQLTISNLETEPLEPAELEAKAQGPELNEVGLCCDGES